MYSFSYVLGWCLHEETHTLIRRHFSSDFQSNQWLSKIMDKVKRDIFAYSLANSRGSGFEVGMPGLLEPFLSQIWMSVRGVGRIMAVGAALLGVGSGIGSLSLLNL